MCSARHVHVICGICFFLWQPYGEEVFLLINTHTHTHNPHNLASAVFEEVDFDDTVFISSIIKIPPYS
jgi:hypothetical protein